MTLYLADATSELCKRYNASRGQLYVKHHSQYQLLEWSRGTLREQLRQFQSKVYDQTLNTKHQCAYNNYEE